MHVIHGINLDTEKDWAPKIYAWEPQEQSSPCSPGTGTIAEEAISIVPSPNRVVRRASRLRRSSNSVLLEYVVETSLPAESNRIREDASENSGNSLLIAGGEDQGGLNRTRKGASEISSRTPTKKGERDRKNAEGASSPTRLGRTRKSALGIRGGSNMPGSPTRVLICRQEGKGDSYILAGDEWEDEDGFLSGGKPPFIFEMRHQYPEGTTEEQRIAQRERAMKTALHVKMKKIIYTETIGVVEQALAGAEKAFAVVDISFDRLLGELYLQGGMFPEISELEVWFITSQIAKLSDCLCVVGGGSPTQTRFKAWVG